MHKSIISALVLCILMLNAPPGGAAPVAPSDGVPNSAIFPSENHSIDHTSQPKHSDYASNSYYMRDDDGSTSESELMPLSLPPTRRILDGLLNGLLGSLLGGKGGGLLNIASAVSEPKSGNVKPQPKPPLSPTNEAIGTGTGTSGDGINTNTRPEIARRASAITDLTKFQSQSELMPLSLPPTRRLLDSLLGGLLGGGGGGLLGGLLGHGGVLNSASAISEPKPGNVKPQPEPLSPTNEAIVTGTGANGDGINTNADTNTKPEKIAVARRATGLMLTI